MATRVAERSEWDRMLAELNVGGPVSGKTFTTEGRNTGALPLLLEWMTRKPHGLEEFEGASRWERLIRGGRGSQREKMMRGDE